MTATIIVACLIALTTGMTSAFPNGLIDDYKDSQLNLEDGGEMVLVPLSFILSSNAALGSPEEEGQVSEGDAAGPASLHRSRRQVDRALDLSLSHNDRNGSPRPVGRVHGSADLFGSGRDARNYHASGSAGLGTVLYRSPNDRHSLGVGAAVSQDFGRFQGYRYSSSPSYGAGLGYRYRF